VSSPVSTEAPNCRRATRRAAIDPRIRDALELMEANCADWPTPVLIASQLGLSRSRFQHLFKQETGATFRRVLRELRLSTASVLLADSRLRIKEVASKCGYAATSNLTRDFQTCLGLSPSQYRLRVWRRRPRPPLLLQRQPATRDVLPLVTHSQRLDSTFR
jgi:AraC family transcriptional regulator of arabinose operon